MALALVVALSGCALPQSPPVRYHTLLPAETQAAPSTQRLAWELLPVAVPAQVDRPQWVVRAADGSLAVLEQERWIAPLADEVHAALAEVLTRRFGPPQGGGWRVVVDVQRLDTVPGRGTRLEASWSVQGAAAIAPALRCAASIEESASGDIGALAQAHRHAVAALGSRIAAALAALASGHQASCDGA
jgi:hypothetical protein